MQQKKTHAIANSQLPIPIIKNNNKQAIWISTIWPIFYLNIQSIPPPKLLLFLFFIIILQWRILRTIEQVLRYLGSHWIEQHCIAYLVLSLHWYYGCLERPLMLYRKFNRFNIFHFNFHFCISPWDHGKKEKKKKALELASDWRWGLLREGKNELWEKKYLVEELFVGGDIFVQWELWNTLFFRRCNFIILFEVSVFIDSFVFFLRKFQLPILLSLPFVTKKKMYNMGSCTLLFVINPTFSFPLGYEICCLGNKYHELLLNWWICPINLLYPCNFFF